MTTSTDPAQRLRDRLVDQLAAAGHLPDLAWREAFRTVPREAFVDRYMVPSPTGDHRVYDLADPAQRDAALTAVYCDTPLVTQHDAHGTATSSSTLPSLMALMLEALDVAEGMSVLEIGTGTGYNAALLAHRLGDAAVTTVDLDPGLVAMARTALDRAGHRPTVVCGDGAAGYPGRAPYDRLIATCGVPRVPVAWLEQVRPGGLLVVNIGHGLARLTVHADGSATGPFLDYSSFMALRNDPAGVATTARDVLALAAGTGTHRATPFPDGLDEPVVVFLRSVVMPGVQQVIEHRDDGPVYVLGDPATGSWARARRDGPGRADVVEGGPRRLWGEVCAVADRWAAEGCPALPSYGLTVRGDGRHELWLDGPHGPHGPRWLLDG